MIKYELHIVHPESDSAWVEKTFDSRQEAEQYINERSSGGFLFDGLAEIEIREVHV